MPKIELPHTSGCLVCGRDNPRGLHLRLFVDDQSGAVETTFTPDASHVGFEGIVHGGVLATVLDEVMVWAATWKVRRFCLCGELTTRFRHSATVGHALTVTAEVEFSRPKLIETAGKIFDDTGRLLATGNAKYIPVSRDHHAQVVQTFVAEAATAATAEILKTSAP